MKGYKAFNSDWKCKGYQFKVGETFEEDITPKLCESGFHFCENLEDCFKFYEFKPTTKIAEVEALGDIDYGECKHCTNEIHIIREIEWEEVLDKINIGKCNTGKSNTGCRNTGNSNIGYHNTGSHNGGHYNAGNYNEGNYNTGRHNYGHYNTGDHNIGSNNTGDFNLTSGNAGCFSTTFPTIPFFNKPSTWTINKWHNSNAYCILRRMPMNTSQRQKWWDELPDSYKKKAMEMPNFDPQIFEEITGIKVD